VYITLILVKQSRREIAPPKPVLGLPRPSHTEKRCTNGRGDPACIARQEDTGSRVMEDLSGAFGLKPSASALDPDPPETVSETDVSQGGWPVA